MNTTTDGRQWNPNLSGICWLPLTLCLLLAAQTGAAHAQGTTASAGSTRLSPGAPLAFTQLMLSAQGQYDSHWNPEDYYNAVISRLQQRGFSVHHSGGALFSQDTPSKTRFMLGGIIDEHRCLPIQGGDIDSVYCGVAVAWELFDRQRNTVVYKVKTRSYVLTSRHRNPPSADVGRLIIGALDSLLSRERFFAAMSDTGLGEATTAVYPFIDPEDLTWQEMYERQNHAATGEQQRATEAWQAEQRQWEVDTLPLRNKQRPYRNLGVALSVLGGVSVVAGGILEIMAAFNNRRAEDYREKWTESVESDDLEDLKQDIIDTEERRDLQHAFGIGGLSLGAASLVTGTVLFALMPELPPRPVRPRYTVAKSPLRVRPVIGASELGLQLTF